MAIKLEDVLRTLNSWVGLNDRDNSHKVIVDVYNSQPKLPRGYRAKLSDPWCAITMTALFVDNGEIPCFAECSCNKMIELLKANNLWIEDESVMPMVGDLVFYDWDDNGVGDNKGIVEHVGMVVDVPHEGVFDVIEGNNTAYGYGTVRRLSLKQNQRYLRGFGRPKYSVEYGRKSNEEIAREVIRGKYGNGDIRKMKLRELGYDPSEIQSIVNKMLKG